MCHSAARFCLFAMLLAGLSAAAGQDAPPVSPPGPFHPGDAGPASPPATGLGPPAAGIGSARAGFDDLGRMLTPPPAPIDQAELAGLPAGGAVPVLTWERAYQLAWVRAHAEPPVRFESLDPALLAERAQALGWGDFARFRAEFVASPTWRDPAADVLDLQARLRGIGIARGGLAVAERWVALLQELVTGEASGLNQADLDRAAAAAASARRELDRLTAEYRDRLDLLKVALGLSPRAAVGMDPSPLAAFAAVDAETDRWMTSPTRELSRLGEIVGRIPPLGDLVVGGRALLAEVEAAPGRLAEALDLATSTALDARRDRDEPADAVELRLRRRIRHLAELRGEYHLLQRSLVLAVGQVDGTFERIIAPPAGPAAAAGGAGATRQAVADLLAQSRQLAERRGRLVAAWAAFQAERLAAERDLGLVGAADWPSFFDRFEARPGQQAPAETPGHPGVPVDPTPPLPPPGG